MSSTKAKLAFVMAAAIILGLCLAASVIAFSSGLLFWSSYNQNSLRAASAVTPARKRIATPTPTPSPINTPTSTATPTPLPTATPTLTPRPTLTPSPTLVPPTETSTFTPAPTDTPTPPPPSFPFIITETAGFETNHLDFDVYVAITDAKNKPLGGYRVIGSHSSGLTVESQVSAGDWTVNSGAMHYKGGNVKFSAPNSPSGTWNLQLVNEANQPVAPAIQFPFDAARPTWNFLLYRRVDD